MHRFHRFQAHFWDLKLLTGSLFALATPATPHFARDVLRGGSSHVILEVGEHSLVGGIPNPLTNILVSWGYYSQ